MEEFLVEFLPLWLFCGLLAIIGAAYDALSSAGLIPRIRIVKTRR